LFGTAKLERFRRCRLRFVRIGASAPLPSFTDADALADQLRQIDNRERDGHERTWKARELYHTRLKTVLGDIDTHVTAIVHGPAVTARTGTGD
jgi:hypothetical protein